MQDSYPLTTLAEENVCLSAGRSLFFLDRKTLVVADLHFGKAETFRAMSIPVPYGSTEKNLERLSAEIDRFEPSRLLVLGDLLHAATGRTPEMLDAVARWREQHPSIEIVVVRGNHDRRAGDPPSNWRMNCVDEPFVEATLAFRHTPGVVADRYTLYGHIHPAISVVGRGRWRERLPCFVFGEHSGILPSFGDFTGMATIKTTRTDRVFVVAGQEVVAYRSPVSRRRN